MPVSPRIPGFLLALILLPSLAFQDTPSKDPFQSMVAVGASLTAGFGNGLPLPDILNEAVQGEHPPIEPLGNAMFFMDAKNNGNLLVERALRKKPTLVFAVDFLFWYSYGHAAGANIVPWNDLSKRRTETEAEIAWRKDLLEVGLRQLDRFGCPIVVGDLPDMWGAHPSMLSPNQVPHPDTLKVLNKRIKEWAAKKKNILLLPFAAWVEEARSGKFPLPGTRPEDGKYLSLDQVIMEDRLHPTQAGVILFCDRMITALRTWLGEEAGSRLSLDVEAALEDRGLELEPLEKAGVPD